MHSGSTIREFMHRYLEVVPPETTILEAAERMKEKSLGSLLVESTGAGGCVSCSSGIVTETDLVRKVLAKEIDPARTIVSQVMTSPLLTIAADCSMLDASHLMNSNNIRYLCVSEQDEIVGIISMRDLARYFVDSAGGPIHDLDNIYQPLSVLMHRTMGTIASERTMLEAAQMITAKRIGSLLVIEAEEMVGIVTETNMVRKGIAPHLSASSTSVGSIMNYPLIQIDINRTIRDASRLMAEERIRHLPVTENNTVVGILSLRDLVKMLSVRDKPRFLRQT